MNWKTLISVLNRWEQNDLILTFFLERPFTMKCRRAQPVFCMHVHSQCILLPLHEVYWLFIFNSIYISVWNTLFVYSAYCLYCKYLFVHEDEFSDVFRRISALVHTCLILFSFVTEIRHFWYFNSNLNLIYTSNISQYFIWK